MHHNIHGTPKNKEQKLRRKLLRQEVSEMLLNINAPY